MRPSSLPRAAFLTLLFGSLAASGCALVAHAADDDGEVSVLFDRHVVELPWGPRSLDIAERSIHGDKDGDDGLTAGAAFYLAGGSALGVIKRAGSTAGFIRTSRAGMRALATFAPAAPEQDSPALLIPLALDDEREQTLHSLVSFKRQKDGKTPTLYVVGRSLPHEDDARALARAREASERLRSSWNIHARFVLVPLPATIDLDDDLGPTAGAELHFDRSGALRGLRMLAVFRGAAAEKVGPVLDELSELTRTAPENELECTRRTTHQVYLSARQAGDRRLLTWSGQSWPAMADATCVRMQTLLEQMSQLVNELVFGRR